MPEKPSAEAAEEILADEIKSEKSDLTQILITAERAGCIRDVLNAAGIAFRKQRAEDHKFRSPAACLLRAREDVVNGYLYSFLLGMDAGTKSRLVETLLADLWMSSKKEAVTDDPNEKKRHPYDEVGAMGILLAMRLASHYYRDLALAGNPDLAGELPCYAMELVRALGEVVKTRPELVKSWAEECIEWPIMAMRHYPKASDFAKLAERIGLGTKSPVQPKKQHTWKPDNRINRYVLEMLVVENWGKGKPLTRESVDYYLDEVLMPLFEKVAEEEGGWEKYPEFAAVAGSAAKRGKKGTQKSEVRNRVKRALMAFTS